MDIKKNRKNSGLLSKKILTTLLVFLTIIGLFSFVNYNINTVELSKKELLFSTVLQGSVEVKIDGYGVLKSKKQQLITSVTRATVKKILLKPGAIVSKDSVIIDLENPALLQKITNAEQELLQKQANLRQLIVNQKREVLTETANLAELTASYETAKLRREAEEKLVKNGIVSELTFKESVLNERQFKQRISFLNERLAQLSLVHTESLNIQQQQINQQQGRLNNFQNMFKKLTVRAGMNGVLQRLPVALGQSLAIGQEVALIGSTKELKALVKVPQNKAQQIAIGQKTIIDTRTDNIIGEVTRINPIVENNTVEVEIGLPKHLPLSARPEQNIDAEVITDILNNILYIERPALTKAFSKSYLYKVAATSHEAKRTAITFGKHLGRYIEIKVGASIDDKFVISDLSQYNNEQITLN